MMASELELFRDHCRKMATAKHKPECCLPRPNFWTDIRPHPGCPGCNPEADKSLFGRLADEVDAYLTNDDAPLWEDA